jgi:beta-aspartyl-peptidase (threonine type)
MRAAARRFTGAGGQALALLDGGGSALDAVEAAVAILEDDPHFNAGRGAVFTYEGRIEHDASIMEGAGRGPARWRDVAHAPPVSLARTVMEKSPHVFLRGLGADQFSQENGLEQVPNEWFHIPERRRQLEEFRKRPDPRRSTSTSNTARSARSRSTGTAAPPPPPRPAG